MGKGMPPRQQFIGQYPHCVKIGGGGSGLAAQQFGGHIGQRAGGRCPLPCHRRQPKINQFDRLPVQQHVSRLHIAVDDAPAVNIDQRLKQLQQQINFGRFPQKAGRLGDGAGGGEQFHTEVGLLLGIKAIILHGDDVGVAQGGQRLKFAGESQPQFAVGSLHGNAKHPFESDHVAGKLVISAINGAHAAAAQWLTKLVTIAQSFNGSLRRVASS